MTRTYFLMSSKAAQMKSPTSVSVQLSSSTMASRWLNFSISEEKKFFIVK